MEDEEDGRGLERVAKACLLIAFYWSSRQYNLGQTWRVKTLRLCTMLGWNQSQKLARYSPLEQYQNSLVFWFTYVWDAYLSILVGDVPFLSLPSEDIQVPLPTKPLSKQTTVPSHRLTVTNAEFYDEEEPLKDLEPFQVMLKCGILTTKVADFWRRFDRGPTKDVNIAKVEVEEDFLALFQTCKNFQSSFPASLLAHLQSKPLASLSPSEVSARDSLYNSQLALSTAFILLHHRCIDPLAPDLYASFHLSGGAAQTALCMLPLYQQLLVERRQWSNPFYVIFGLAGKVLFRNLTILKHSKLGEADQTLRLEMTVFEAVRRMKEVARAWRGLSPSIIPLLRLMETPEICLSRGFDLMKVGRL
ncbi:hypothetical protein BT69DRAFT_377811 [Atractiella rhizophila]|nr:hypothetical protein BT69DRAFT_377811 [Atractiella rhizophila]